MKLSDKIKKFRKENDLTQQDLANKLFVSRSAVAKWEQDRGFPDKETLSTLSSLLNEPEEELITLKDVNAIAINTVETISKQKKIIVFSCVLLGILLVFSIFFTFVLFKRENPPTTKIQNSATYGYIEKTDQSFNFYSYDKKENKIPCFPTQALIDDSLVCLDRWGKTTDIETIRSGYKVKIFYTETTPPSSNTNITVNKIEIVDDYIEGDFLIKGFFLSTEEYEGDVVPIYNKRLGYDAYRPNIVPGNPTEVYEYIENGIYWAPSFRYPYIHFSGTGVHTAGMIEPTMVKDILINTSTNTKVEQQHKAQNIRLSNKISSLYVYALDNSNQGFHLYEKINRKSEPYSLSILTKGLLDNSSLSPSISDSIYASFELNIVWSKTVNYVHIREYDQEHTLLKTSFVKTYEENNVFKNREYYTGQFKLMDNTNYVLLTENSGLTGIYEKGDAVSRIYLPTKYGYLFPSFIQFT